MKEDARLRDPASEEVEEPVVEPPLDKSELLVAPSGVVLVALGELGGDKTCATDVRKRLSREALRQRRDSQN